LLKEADMIATQTFLGRLEAAEARTRSRRIARHAPTAARILVGLPFFVSGLNGFLNFLPQPTTPLPAGAGAFLVALVNTGYMLPLIMATQLVVGALLLSNRFVPLALVLIAPFLVNSLAFHIVLEPSGRGIAAVFSALVVYVAWGYRDAYRSMLVMRAQPA
jgi:uncharacterized membrane protein YphA (DoxX/SURF4 family)